MRRLCLPLLVIFALMLIGCGKETVETTTPGVDPNGPIPAPKAEGKRGGKVKPKLAP